MPTPAAPDEVTIIPVISPAIVLEGDEAFRDCQR